MPESFAEVEERVTQAIAVLDIRGNVSRNKIAQESRVPVQRLRSRLNGNPPANTVSGLHGRRLPPDQEKALHDYFIHQDKTGMPARLDMIEQGANSIPRMSADPTTP